MHPAFSVIFFTTLSGSGCGLLAWSALLQMSGVAAGRGTLAVLPSVLGLALVAIGLLASLAHLGKPLRAWRAFSQWQTSWLSREGVCAVALFVPALWLAWVAWTQGGASAPSFAPGLLTIALSLATTVCTAMIYASLRPIPAWRDALVVPGYLLMSLVGGGLWTAACVALAAPGLLAALAPYVASVLVALIAATAGVKIAYWRRIDRKPGLPTLAAAIGLPALGRVRSFERPHTETNYLLREMGFVLARRHARRLRAIVLLAGLLLPALLSIAASTTVAAAWVGWVSAALLFQLAALVERWLFFAQARHVISTYYGVESND